MFEPTAVNGAWTNFIGMLRKLGGDIAQEGIAILRRQRPRAVHHDGKLVIAERSTG